MTKKFEKRRRGRGRGRGRRKLHDVSTSGELE